MLLLAHEESAERGLSKSENGVCFGFLCKQSLTQEVESKPVFLGEGKEEITPGSQGE